MEYIERQKDDGTGELPDLMLHDPDVAFPIWRLLHGFDYRFPPDVLLRQGEALMNDLLALEDVYHRLHHD